MNIQMSPEEIKDLTLKVVRKYEIDTGVPIIITQWLGNYKDLVIMLSDRSKKLRGTTGNKYDIKEAQFRDALFGKVRNMKDYFYEVCMDYIGEKIVHLEIDEPPPTNGSPELVIAAGVIILSFLIAFGVICGA